LPGLGVQHNPFEIAGRRIEREHLIGIGPDHIEEVSNGAAGVAISLPLDEKRPSSPKARLGVE
jgi:hypothetical protein